MAMMPQLAGSGLPLKEAPLPFSGLLPLSPSPTVRFPSPVVRSNFIVKAATIVAPKYTTVKPLGGRVLIKIKSSEEKTTGGIILPSTAQSKPQGGEVVIVGDGRTIGKTKVDVSVKVAEAEVKTAGGLLLTEAAKEKPSIGTVVAVGPGAVDEEGSRKPLIVAPGSTVLYPKYAGNEFKSVDGSDYIALRASDLMAVLF